MSYYARLTQWVVIDSFVWEILGGMAFATCGMWVSDYIEQQFPASDKEKQHAEAMSPIVVVDHKDK